MEGKNIINIEVRRKFLKICGRVLAIAAILLLIGFAFQKTQVKEADYFWQIDPEKCTFCGGCEKECVLPVSAVKCVHAVKMCGYCDLCGGYYRTNVKELNTAAENLSCPTGAIKRKFVEEPYFEYTIDEDLCNACGKCAKGCNDFGNGSLYLQIKQDLCKNCNECQIAKNCPAGAIRKVPMSKAYNLKESSHQNRFPKPDFESGYVYPEKKFVVPVEHLWSYIDIAILLILMSFVSWAVIKKQVRLPVLITSVISVAYFGFFRHGCVCSIGAIQNISLALTNHSYTVPLFVLLIFILPIIFALLFGRVFCAGVCPIGALQELVNIKNYRISKVVSSVLKLFPWIYLAFAVLFAITNSRFIICRFDPFVGIFRLGGELPLILFGVALLIISIFTGRPFCRFICPYGAILSLFSRISFFKIKITKNECINCQLCHNACPVDAIQPPYENKVKESRKAGVNRILKYLIFLPIMVGGGAFFMFTFGKFAAEIELINGDYKIFSIIIGAFLGLVVALYLIRLSTKRTRKLYEIESADCVGCGRCFSYCPQGQELKESGVKGVRS